MKLWVQTTRAVLGSLALAFSTMGIAQAEDAGAQPLSAADQLPPDQEVSETAIELAGWVLASRDAHGYPFAIIDKESAQILVFGADGRLRGAAPGLFGSARGDHIAPGVAGLALSAIPGRDRTTPAGRFVGGYGPSIDAGPVLWVDYDSAVSIHPIAMVPRERRAERLASPTPNDNRITHGCINVSPEFYERIIQPTFARGGVFYILPDRDSLEETFPDFAQSRTPDARRAERTRKRQHQNAQRAKRKRRPFCLRTARSPNAQNKRSGPGGPLLRRFAS